MAGKEIAVKKYVVRLTAEERAQLDELISKGKRSAQLLTKARILLKAVGCGRGLERQSDCRGAGHQHRHYRADQAPAAHRGFRDRGALPPLPTPTKPTDISFNRSHEAVH